jgi:hypothetical protein
MTDLTVKRFLLNHWDMVLLIVLAFLVGFAVYTLIENLFVKPRRERESNRLRAMRDEIEKKKAIENLGIELAQKEQELVVLDKLMSQGEIHEMHYQIIRQNWDNWSSDKISAQIKNAVMKFQMDREESNRRDLLLARLRVEFSESRISKDKFDLLLSKFDNDDVTSLEKEVNLELQNYARKLKLVEIYGEEDALRILGGQYWLGMSEEQLIETLGQPSAIQKEVLKTKEKIIYIYGKRTTGDVFTFVNGALEAVKDR